jgi:uncharacterized protein (DUF427 family)
MTLMLGTAPFGSRPAGRFNFDLPRDDVAYLEACPRRIRGARDGKTVIDSTRAHLLHRRSHLAVWAFPPEDVPPGMGEPVEGGLVHVAFEDLDAWYEEDEQVFGHPRDPFTRIDVLPSSRLVRITLGGELLAESERAKALFETGLPVRWYVPREDVRMELLEPCPVTSRCAYKGVASYWDVGDERVLAWTYPDPAWDGERVRDLVCFFNERVDLDLDGEREERPRTPWRTAAWAERPQGTGGEKDFG